LLNALNRVNLSEEKSITAVDKLPLMPIHQFLTHLLDSSLPILIERIGANVLVLGGY
jgi:hypothetical protein